MRVIFETPPVPISLNYNGSGRLYAGFGQLRVLAFDADEDPPMIPGTTKTYRVPRSLAALRAEGNGRVIAIPSRSFRDAMPPVEIPESVLEALPADTKLHFGWHFKPGAP